jgi:hypothetical protein
MRFLAIPSSPRKVIEYAGRSQFFGPGAQVGALIQTPREPKIAGKRLARPAPATAGLQNRALPR